MATAISWGDQRGEIHRVLSCTREAKCHSNHQRAARHACVQATDRTEIGLLRLPVGAPENYRHENFHFASQPLRSHLSAPGTQPPIERNEGCASDTVIHVIVQNAFDNPSGDTMRTGLGPPLSEACVVSLARERTDARERHPPPRRNPLQPRRLRTGQCRPNLPIHAPCCQSADVLSCSGSIRCRF